MSEKNESKIGAFWRNDDKDFLSGVIECPHCHEEMRVVMFENSYKKSAKHPDFNLLLSKSKKEKEAEDDRRDRKDDRDERSKQKEDRDDYKKGYSDKKDSSKKKKSIF